MYPYSEPFVVMSRIYQCVFRQRENLLSREDESERIEGTFSIMVCFFFFSFVLKIRSSFYVLACEWTESYNLSELPPCHKVRKNIDIIRQRNRYHAWKASKMRMPLACIVAFLCPTISGGDIIKTKHDIINNDICHYPFYF